MSDYGKVIIDSIKSIFNTSEESLSSLITMLNNAEENRIRRRFYLKVAKQFSDNEIISKINLLIALMELVLENPNMEKIDSHERKSLLLELYITTTSLYEQMLEHNEERIWERMPYATMYSMLSYLADKQTISAMTIDEFLSRLNARKEEFSKISPLSKLEYYSYYLIISILSNIKNQAGLVNLESIIANAQSVLEEIQDEMLKEEMDVQEGLKVTAFGNIIYLTSLLKDYLFKGSISDEENQDIFSVIDIYSYNIFSLLSEEDISIKVIGHLIKYAYTQVAENSVWSIAEKSPMIKAFIEENIMGTNKYIYSLLPSQRDVISEVLTPKKSIIVTMPTSAGKSFLAEMQILFTLHNYHTVDFKPTVCYIVPTNALIEQVKKDLNEDFKGFLLNIETVLPFYDIDELENEFLCREHIDILISTPEKLESLIRQRHSAIQNTKLIVMDEAHNIGDQSRGSKFELVLAATKQNMKEVNFLLLSPFMSNADEIGEWLADSQRDSTVVSVEWTPTRQYIGCNILKKNKKESILEFYKSARNYISAENIEILLQKSPINVKRELNVEKIDSVVKLCVLINDFMFHDGNVLILCGGKGTSKKFARKITEYFVNQNVLKDISNDPKVKRVLEIIKLETNDKDPLINCIKYGVCYHNAGLSSLVKESIEVLIRDGFIKLVFATTTLAQGMNFPINTVIFDVVSFRGRTPSEMTNAEFWNIAGRAGRTYKDKEGYIIISYSSSPGETREKIKRYIKMDAEKVVSTLNTFFAKSGTISLTYDFLRQSENSPILNLIQYINHILNIGYEYNISPSEMAKIRTILNDSFLYHSLSKQEGFVNAQMKLNTFVTQYIRHIKEKKKDDLEKADLLGISDISFSKVKSIIGAFVMNLKEQGDLDYRASDIILKTKNIDRLAEIINIISKIPEIKIEMINQGSFDPKSVAKLLVGWVNGERINDIAKSIVRDNQSLEDAIELCNGYLNSQMKSYMPWGINIYQEISYDLSSDNAKMLPSYIYYGVSDKELVLLSKIGVPRFAVKNTLSSIRKLYPEIEFSVKNLKSIKEMVKSMQADNYEINNFSGNVIKEIVDNRIS